MVWVYDRDTETGKQQAVQIEGVYSEDIELLAPLIVGIRATEGGNGNGYFEMNACSITKRRFTPDLPIKRKKRSA